MLIERTHRDELCRRLQDVRRAAISLERELLLDRVSPTKVTLRTYGLGSQVDELGECVLTLLRRERATPWTV
jgi:hypothetical protein